MQYIYARYSFILAASILCFAIGAFLFALTVVNDIKCCLKSIHDSAKTKDHRLILMRLTNFFQYFSDAKQLRSSEIVKAIKENMNVFFFAFFSRSIYCFWDLFQPILLTLFTFGFISICCTVLIIQMELVQ